MKKCPKCSRTYADDGFTFCLEDGALLSPPYDVGKSDEPVSTIQNGGPPPTAVLPRTDTGHKVPPRVKTAPSPANSEEATPQIRVHPESPRRTSALKYVVIGLVALVIVATGVGFLGLYMAGSSNCPRLTISCFPLSPTAYCDVVEDKSLTSNNLEAKPISAALCSRSIFLLQEAALPEGVTEVSWSTSLGTPRWIKQRQLIIDTSELAGKTIEVKAKVTTSSWFCSTTVSTSFNVPSAPSK